MKPAASASDTPIGRIRATGSRATPARIDVLGILLKADRALSHAEIEASLAGRQVDRVTIYRALDWLVESGLAHRIADGHRVFRFSAAGAAGHHDEHAHFSCERCGRVYCLEDLTAVGPVDLPAGFKATHIDLSLRGECANCRHAGAR